MIYSDQEMIEQVAKLWVDLGGDAEGLAWCYDKLRDAIVYEVARRDECPANSD